MMNKHNKPRKSSVLAILAGSVVLIALVTLWLVGPGKPSDLAAGGMPTTGRPDRPSRSSGGPPDASAPPALPKKRGVPADRKTSPGIHEGLSALGWALEADRVGSKSAEGSVKLTQPDGSMILVDEIRTSPEGGFVGVGPVEFVGIDGQRSKVHSSNGESFRIMPDGSAVISASAGAGSEILFEKADENGDYAMEWFKGDSPDPEAR